MLPCVSGSHRYDFCFLPRRYVSCQNRIDIDFCFVATYRSISTYVSKRGGSIEHTNTIISPVSTTVLEHTNTPWTKHVHLVSYIEAACWPWKVPRVGRACLHVISTGSTGWDGTRLLTHGRTCVPVYVCYFIF